MKIGVTGHQSLEKDSILWVRKEIDIEIKKNNVEKGFTSLAIGADQIFANVLLENKIPIVAVIPSESYDETFDKNHIGEYLNLLRQSESKLELAYEEPTEIAFYRAGKIIAENSDVLFAIWDGKPAKGLGGTADIVEYMKALSKKIIHFNITNKIVTYIN